MSFTQSRGLHTVERWQTPAGVILEGLKTKGGIPKGAFKSLEKFFSWVLAGIEYEKTRTLPRGIPDMGPICALSIAMKTFHYSNHTKLTKPMQADLRIVRRMHNESRRVGTKKERQAFRKRLSLLAGPEDPEFQRRFNVAKRKWTKKLQPLVDAAQTSRRITEKDLQIVINV